MPTNWPPTTAPAWPPPEIGSGPGAGLSCSDLRTLVAILLEAGFAHAAPTSAERAAFFTPARCDHAHQVIGRMLVSPSGVRYPVAACNNTTHRDVLVPWPPYYTGAGSANHTW